MSCTKFLPSQCFTALNMQNVNTLWYNPQLYLTYFQTPNTTMKPSHIVKCIVF